MPSSYLHIAVLGSVALLGAPDAAVAQPLDSGAGLSPGVRIVIRFVVAFFVNLLLGGGLVVFGPAYARTTVNRLRSDPGGAFVWGLLVGVGVPVVLVLLAITVVGLVVAIPGFVVLAVVGLVGNAVTILWVGELFAGSPDELVSGRAAVVGALALAVPAAIPVVGNFLTTAIGLFGIGVVGRRLYESWWA